jgi:hypothetical protein
VPSGCHASADCDDRDPCTLDDCDSERRCVNAVRPPSELVRCTVEAAKVTAGTPPGLGCSGKCRCNLVPALERVAKLADAASNTTRSSRCRRLLAKAERSSAMQARRVERLAAKGCVSPSERAARLVAELERLAERARQASASCGQP